MPNYFGSFNYLKFNDYIKKSSKLCLSYEQIKKNIELILNLKKRKKIKFKLLEKKSFNQIFFNANGKASPKISKCIINLKLKPKKNKNEYINNFFLNNSLKEKLMNFFYLYDPFIYRIVRNMITPWKLRTKELNLNLIEDELKKLMKFTNVKKKVFVQRAITKNYEAAKIHKTLAFEIKT